MSMTQRPADVLSLISPLNRLLPRLRDLQVPEGKTLSFSDLGGEFHGGS